MDPVTFNHIRRRCGPEVDGQLLTITADKMHEPSDMKTVEAPPDLFMSVSLNLHMEERKDRQIKWLTEDIDHELEKLETIFAEAPYKEVGLKPLTEIIQEKDTPHEKLHILTAMADWLAEANIDAETYSANVSMEENKKAEAKLKTAAVTIHDQLTKLINIHESSIDMAKKFRSFIASREAIYNEFVDYLSGKRRQQTEDESSEEKSKYRTTEFIEKLKSLQIEGFAEMEHQVLKWETQLGKQEDIIADQLSTLSQLEEDFSTIRQKFSKVEDNKSQIISILSEIEESVINALSIVDNKEEIIGPIHENFESCAEIIFNMDTTSAISETQAKLEDGAQKKKEKSTDCDSALIPLLCVHG